MTEPDVTVVVGVYNGLPYLRTCLASLAEQTLGPGRLDVVVVDDGSTDGSGEYAEHFAHSTEVPVRVVHQENSGGPSRPRNVGLDAARGRYVFFLDADDYLGAEALERMVAMADRNKTDVVLGRITGVNRKAPQSMFTENVERTDPYSHNAMKTMRAEKLFRRSLLRRHGIRFDEGIAHGEDTCFTIEAYVRADGLSIVADRPCVYLVGRTDGRNLTKAANADTTFRAARAQLELIDRLLPPGTRRDVLSVGPFRMKVLRMFPARMRREPEETWQRLFDLVTPLIEEHLTPGVEHRMHADERLRLHCITRRRSDLLLDVLRLQAARDRAERCR